jgi:hypothetical protein
VDPDRIDYSPLSARPLDDEVGAVAEQRGNPAVFSAVLVGGVLSFIVVLVLVVSAVGGELNGETLATAAIFLAGCLGIGVVIAVVVHWQHRRGSRRSARLTAFSEANGLSLRLEAPMRARPGSLLGVTTNARLHDQVTWHHRGLDFEVATYRRYAGSRVGSTIVRHLAVSLDVDPPRLTFYGEYGSFKPGPITGTNAHEGLDYPLNARVSQHARARAFMTDGLVHALTRDGRTANAEVADGWFFAYLRGDNVLKEAAWRQVFAVADAVVDAQESLRAADRATPDVRSS